MTTTPTKPLPETVETDDLLLFSEPPKKDTSLFEQVSNPPRRFHLSLLLLMLWGGIALALSPLMPLQLPNPAPWLSHQSVELVPYVFQIPLVVLISGVFGYRYGAMVIFLTLFAGFLGLPVFAAGGGMAYWLQPTVGYILAFLAVPYILRRPLRKALRKKRPQLYRLIPAGLVSVLSIHAIGLLGVTLHHMLTHQPWFLWLPNAFQYTNAMALYDLGFSWVALMLIRPVRLALWPGLY